MRLLWLAFCLLLAATASASAHGPHPEPEGMVAGLQHPFFVPAHILAIAALGLRLGQSSTNQVIYGVIVFGVALIAGFLIALSEFYSRYTEIVLLSFAIIVALLTLAGVKKWPFEITATSIIFAVIIGVDSGAGVESLSNPLATLSGSAFTIFLLYAYWMFMIRLVSGVQLEWISIGIRVAASWVTAIAAMVITLFFATSGTVVG